MEQTEARDHPPEAEGSSTDPCQAFPRPPCLPARSTLEIQHRYKLQPRRRQWLVEGSEHHDADRTVHVMAHHPVDTAQMHVA